MRSARPAVIGLLGAFTLLGCPAHGRPRAARPVRVAATSADATLERQVFDTRPPRVEYRLTEAGRRLRYVVEALNAWAVASA